MAKHEILVIGSKDHNRADCVDWLEPFPNIEEYDSIIINMQSLTQKDYDKIQSKIKEMRDSIRTIIDTGREVFCVINELIYPSPPRVRPGEPVHKSIDPWYVFPTNYDWLPARIDLNSQKKGGNRIFLRNSRFQNYFELIYKWNFEISLAMDTVPDLARSFLNLLEPIAVNKSEKTVACSLRRIEDRKKLIEGEKIGMVHLLPPPKESSLFQAIELLIDLIIGTEGKVIVAWRKQIDVPNEQVLKEKVDKKLGEIKNIQHEISQLQEQIESWDSYRDLLTETGEYLENIVQKTLIDLGIKTKKTKKGFPADLLSEEVAVEVTGIKGCLTVGSEKVNQVGRFREKHRKKEKIILIANTFMDYPPKDRERKMNFSKEAATYFEALSVCFMTTVTLFQLWKNVVIGKQEQKNVKSKILTKVGELTLRDFK